MHFGDARAPGDETHQGSTAGVAAGEGGWGCVQSVLEKDLGLVICAAQGEELEWLEGEMGSRRGEFLRKMGASGWTRPLSARAGREEMAEDWERFEKVQRSWNRRRE